MIDKQQETTSKNPSSLVTTDSPDDFAYEGNFNIPDKASKKAQPGDKAYVTVDNPDDFE